MQSRRDFLKKVGYAAPAIVTLNAVPAFAGTGSGRPSGKQHRRRHRRRGHREHRDGNRH